MSEVTGSSICLRVAALTMSNMNAVYIWLCGGMWMVARQRKNEYVYPGFADKEQFQCRSIVQSQVNLLDDIVGQIVDKLKENELWDDTLLIFTTDNGGSLDLDETAGNNYPLRGGKMSNLEGGIRATTFVSGGYSELPHQIQLSLRRMEMRQKVGSI